ncbi:MAG: alpha/beta hydrolase [Candidatus Pacebacteria bacterium]|nr:alpha/beta hydrolase [Candidatus Paceibacterota bacterium]
MFPKILKIIAKILIILFLIILSIYFYNVWFVEIKKPVDSAPVDTKFIDIGGEQIAYSEVDNNSSTTVVFVGGLSSWSGSWERVVKEINLRKNNYNYIVIDLPPFGYSIIDANNNYFRDTQAKRIGNFVEAKKIENVILVGHSYGAGPVTEYVLNNQEKVEKLILIDAVLNIDEVKVDGKYSPVQFSLLRNVAIGVVVHNDTFALSSLRKFVFVTDNINQELLDVYTRYFDTEDTSKDLSTWLRDYINDPLNYKSNFSDNYKTLTVPVRIIWGDKDTVTPLVGTNVLIKNIPNVKLVTLENIGHIPMIENQTLFDEALLEVLNN